MANGSARSKQDLTDWQPANADEYKQVLSIISPQLHPYVAEHAELSTLMDEVREGFNRDVYRTALDAIGEELEHHFRYEEDFILSKLANHIPTEEAGPIKKLKSEHQIIRDRHADVSKLLGESPSEAVDKELMQKMNLLAYLLKKHIEKEDHYFFPLVSLILTEAEKDQIAAEIAAAGRHSDI